MKSVLVGVLKRWKMASATVLGFFFQRAILAGTSLALMSQMGIVLKEGSRETRAVSVVGTAHKAPAQERVQKMRGAQQTAHLSSG